MSTNRKYHRGASRPGINFNDTLPGSVRYLTPEQYRAEVLGLPPIQPTPRHWPWVVAVALVAAFTLGYCAPAPAQELRDPYLDAMRDHTRELERIESQYQVDRAERDMQERRQRYADERRYEERRNDTYFNWGPSWPNWDRRRR